MRLCEVYLSRIKMRAKDDKLLTGIPYAVGMR